MQIQINSSSESGSTLFAKAYLSQYVGLLRLIYFHGRKAALLELFSVRLKWGSTLKETRKISIPFGWFKKGFIWSYATLMMLSNSVTPESGQDGPRMSFYWLRSRLGDVLLSYIETLRPIEFYIMIFFHTYVFTTYKSETYNCSSLCVGLDNDHNTIGNYTGL